MTSSRFESEQYISEAFVESAGAVLFRLPSQEICILRLLETDEYVLPKGRRNCGERRREAALREVAEETGYSCRLLSLNMCTRAPPATETEKMGDESRFYTAICEPFTLQIRRLEDCHIKLIWWYAAAVDEHGLVRAGEQERFAVEFYSYADVLEKLTFQLDRDVVERAISLVIHTYGA